MDAPSYNLHWFDDNFRFPFANEFGPHYKDLEEIAIALLNSYAKFARHGMPGETIAYVMVEATINFHRLFVTPSELPALLRDLADRIEHEPAVWPN